MLIGENYMTADQIAFDLINIPSVTGNERQVLEHLELLLEQMNLKVEREAVGADRWNLYAGWKDDTDIVFCTHVDTVPPFIPARRKDDLLLGRGACDTKGIIAAMLAAGKQLIESGHHPAFLFVVGEETDSIGAKTAAQAGRTAEFIIVGEPTENILATGHKGVLSYTLTASGSAAHSAYPEMGVSAIHSLLDILQDIRAAEWGVSDTLGPSTTNIGLLEGGEAMNTFAPSASASVMHRIIDEPEKRKLQVLHIVDKRAEIAFHSISQPQILSTVEGFPLRAVSFGTDIPYLSSMGKCLLFGPGSIHDAHTADEKISISEMNEATILYVRLFHALRRL